MKTLSLSRTTQLLIAANLTLAMIVSAELLLPTQPGTANAAASDSGDVMLPDFGNTKIAAPPIAQFVDMRERPLFFPNRRIPEPKVELQGIAIAGGSRVAVLHDLNGRGVVQLAEGDSHTGWTLDSLAKDKASFSRDGQTTELLLDPGQ